MDNTVAQTDLRIQDPAAVVVAIAPCKGRHAVVSLLTALGGRIRGFLKDGSHPAGPKLCPGDRVAVTWSARRPEHLGEIQVQAPRRWARPAQARAAIGAALAMVALFLPERDPEPAAYLALAELELRLEAGQDTRASYRLFEERLAAAAGFGGDITEAFLGLDLRSPAERDALRQLLESA